MPDKRNYGIDALRLYAVFLVVILHVLLQGGILDDYSAVRRLFRNNPFLTSN